MSLGLCASVCAARGGIREGLFTGKQHELLGGGRYWHREPIEEELGV